MTLNMCSCIDKLCQPKLFEGIIKFQRPGVVLIQMKIKITKENVSQLDKAAPSRTMPNSSRNYDFERFGGL